jgi:predicted DsbA family dithiol-disulfide isomerase
MAAIDECQSESLPLKFKVEYKPIRLSCQLPEDFSVDRRTYFTKKFGEEYTPVITMMQAMGKSLGLEIVADGRLSQTTRAHRLAMKAYAVGGEETQQALIRAYFDAYFTEGKDIGDVELLGDLAAKVGFMTKAEAMAFVKSKELEKAVDTLVATAKANGITGSPVVIVDGKFKLDGVQPKDTYLQVFKRLGKCEQAMATGSPCSEASSEATVVSPSPKPVAV